MPEESKTGPDPAVVAWDRARNALDKLFDALQDLDEAGGLKHAINVGGWAFPKVVKACETLEAPRDSIEMTLEPLAKARDRAERGRERRGIDRRPY